MESFSDEGFPLLRRDMWACLAELSGRPIELAWLNPVQYENLGTAVLSLGQTELGDKH